MSAFLRGSLNYVWCTTGVLGKGATGAVFQGVSRRDGEPVAVKTFNQLSYMRSHEVQMREFEVLRKVHHGNIVKLLAIEEEQEGRGKVIVMELCTGGSLFNILDDPENAYGLPENEFMLVLEHLSAGMKHLRDNNVVHRDLKPGNIMKFIADDGQTIYKLTDFGAARELEEDQEFMSLYGTEEYLHPDLYERAVLRKPVGKTFSATVDLWSIGVTLYHVATGNLPFRPYGGRKNKETMYYITTKKASGVISGIQMSENGPIDWYTTLPNSCQLSDGLKSLVTPLLGGLLEVDTQKMWSFERFFNEVTKLLECKIIHVFYVNKLKPLRIYIHPEHVFEDFQALVHRQTQIAPSSQIVLFREDSLLNTISTETMGACYPETQEDNPVILFHRENNNAVLEPSIELPKFPSFPNTVSVEHDASMGKLACSVGHVYKRRIEKLSQASSLMQLSEKTLVSVITQLLERTFKQSDHSKYTTKLLGKELQTLLSWEKSIDIVFQMHPTLKNKADIKGQLHDLSDMMQNKQYHFGVLNQQLSSSVLAIQQLYSKCVTNQTLHTEWKGTTQLIPDVSKSSAKVATYIKKLRDSWQHLLRDKASRNLTYNDEQFHILEKLKMQKTGKDITELLIVECQSPVGLLVEALADWYKMAQAVFLQVEILEKDIAVYDLKQASFVQEVDHLQESYTRDITILLENLQCNNISDNNKIDVKDVIPPAVKKRNSKLVNTFDRSLRELTTVQEQVFSILKENSELVTQFQQLTLTLLPDEIKNNDIIDSNKINNV